VDEFTVLELSADEFAVVELAAVELAVVELEVVELAVVELAVVEFAVVELAAVELAAVELASVELVFTWMLLLRSSVGFSAMCGSFCWILPAGLHPIHLYSALSVLSTWCLDLIPVQHLC